MSVALTDEKWKRRGISVLWCGRTLAELNAASQVISLRQFICFYEAGWPEDMPLLNDAGLFVAGLDVAVDALSPEDALEWLESEIYEMIYDFQNHADAALIFWMPDQGRWKEDVTTSTYHWYLAGKYDAQVFPLGQCIWNGAQKDVRRIESAASSGRNSEWLGLYLERIS
ncbi:MAG: hypothetical protein ACRCVQ_15570 [Acinetobacter ursingii]